MNMNKSIITIFAVTLLLLTGCFGGKSTLSTGGEVTGIGGGRGFAEPTPYGMTLVKRGHLKMGINKQS